MSEPSSSESSPIRQVVVVDVDEISELDGSVPSAGKIVVVVVTVLTTVLLPSTLLLVETKPEEVPKLDPGEGNSSRN